MRFKQWLHLESLRPLPPGDTIKFIGFAGPSGVDVEVATGVGQSHDLLWERSKGRGIASVQSGVGLEKDVLNGVFTPMGSIRALRFYDDPMNAHMVGDVLQKLMELGYIDDQTYVSLRSGGMRKAGDLMNKNPRAAAAQVVKPQTQEEKDALRMSDHQAQVRAQFGSDAEYEAFRGKVRNNREREEVIALLKRSGTFGVDPGLMGRAISAGLSDDEIRLLSNRHRGSGL